MATVTFITRTKDRPLLLRRAIESALNQTSNNWNMAIVNDGGAQDLVNELVEEYKDDFNGRLTLIHNQTSLGMEAASNIGIKATDSNYVMIHDDDDSLAPEFVSTMVPMIEEYQKLFPNLRGILARANLVYESIERGQVSVTDVHPYNTHIKPGLLQINKLLEINSFAPIQFMFCRSVFSEIGYYNEQLPVLGDWDFNIRFLQKYDIYLSHYYLSFYHHRMGSNNQYGNSVIAGDSKHKLYNEYIKNQVVRQNFASAQLLSLLKDR